MRFSAEITFWLTIVNVTLIYRQIVIHVYIVERIISLISSILIVEEEIKLLL